MNQGKYQLGLIITSHIIILGGKHIFRPAAIGTLSIHCPECSPEVTRPNPTDQLRLSGAHTQYAGVVGWIQCSTPEARNSSIHPSNLSFSLMRFYQSLIQTGTIKPHLVSPARGVRWYWCLSSLLKRPNRGPSK